MSVRAYRASRGYLLLGSALLALMGLGGAASAQVNLPEVVVSGAKPKPKPRRAHVATPAPAAPVTPAAQLNAKARAFSGLTESAGFSPGWICDSTFVSNRHGGCDGQAIFSGLA
jgi:hypothetical protein